MAAAGPLQAERLAVEAQEAAVELQAPSRAPRLGLHPETASRPPVPESQQEPVQQQAVVQRAVPDQPSS